MSFSVLFVCTGNVCRSPIAERIFTARVGWRFVDDGQQCGTASPRGPPDGRTVGHRVARARRRPRSPRRPQLDPELAAVADLVLTATSAQRAVVTQQNPQIYRRTFTLLEFGRLARDLDRLAAGAAAARPPTRSCEQGSIPSPRGAATRPPPKPGRRHRRSVRPLARRRSSHGRPHRRRRRRRYRCPGSGPG